MNYLPKHGRIECEKCFGGCKPDFDRTRIEDNGWRITSNPMAWGSQTPEVVVLGFSKGPTQAGTLASSAHDSIAYKGGRVAVGKILRHVGLLNASLPDESLGSTVDRLIADPNGRFHFGSLIRCTVERWDDKKEEWKGSGGGMLDKFIATDFGSRIASNCTQTFLRDLSDSTKLILMFGMGTQQKYVTDAMKLYQLARPGQWKRLNDVAYTDGKVTVVHVEHFASQGALLPNWLGGNKHSRSRFGLMSREAVNRALN